MRERLREWAEAARAWAARTLKRWSETDHLSWWGHAAQGALLTLLWSSIGVALWQDAPGLDAAGAGLRQATFALASLWGPVATVNVFGHREVDNFVVPALDPEIGVKAALEKLRRDGLMDYFAPYLASVATWMALVLAHHAAGTV